MDLSDFFTTKAQATDFSTRLSSILESTYKTGFNLEKALMEQFGIEKKDKFTALLRDNNVSIDSIEVLKIFFTKIQESIANMTILPIIIAFEPKEQTLKTLSDWFLMNLKKQMLFDIKVDKNIIGGAAITYNGKFMDFSVKSKFDQIINNILYKQPNTTPTQVVHQDVNNMHVGR